MTSAWYQTVLSVVMIVYYWLYSMVIWMIPKSWRPKDIAGETCLITGAGSGIGRLLAVRFARRGARVVCWDLNLEGAKETAKIIRDEGGEAHAYHCDVSRRENVYEAAALVKREVGKVDILVNNAGIVSGKRFMDIPDHMIQKTFEVNAMAHFWTLKAFLPDMMESNHGHLVSIASMAGLCGVVKLSDYCASKFAAVGLEESLRLELYFEGYTGIKSTVVCPYFINTGMFEGAKPGLFTMMSPEYVADQVVASVLVDQEVVLLPKPFTFLMILKSILPPQAIREALSQLNISSSMRGFSGHRPAVKPKMKLLNQQLNNNNNESMKIKGL